MTAEDRDRPESSRVRVGRDRGSESRTSDSVAVAGRSAEEEQNPGSVSTGTSSSAILLSTPPVPTGSAGAGEPSRVEAKPAPDPQASCRQSRDTGSRAVDELALEPCPESDIRWAGLARHRKQFTPDNARAPRQGPECFHRGAQRCESNYSDDDLEWYHSVAPASCWRSRCSPGALMHSRDFASGLATSMSRAHQ